MSDFQIFFQNGSGNANGTSLPYYTTRVMETITETMSKLFREMNSLASTSLGWMIAWDLTAAERRRYWTTHSSVIHVLRSPSNSLIAAANVTGSSSGGDAAGRTATLNDGVLSEVYVEGNMPADKLAHIAFHELMHNRLDVGATVVSINNSTDPKQAGIHNVGLGGGGLAATPTTGLASLTGRNATLMARNLRTNVRQSTRFLLS